MTINLDPTVTCPDFSADPLGYYIWHLEHHGEMYRMFRATADAYRAADPSRRLSADMICHVMRYNSVVHAQDDHFQVNNVLTPLYARLYRHERPDAVMDTRKSMLDSLTNDEKERLNAAWKVAKGESRDET